jgi:simple sugar transport system ATP-binding protein
MLLLDEPTSALSVRETDKLLSHLSDLKGEGVSAVFITHNLYHAYESCDRFTILSHGGVIRIVRKADISLRELNEIIVKY